MLINTLVWFLLNIPAKFLQSYEPLDLLTYSGKIYKVGGYVCAKADACTEGQS